MTSNLHRRRLGLGVLLMASIGALLAPPGWAAESGQVAAADPAPTEAGVSPARAATPTEMVRGTSDSVLELIASAKGYAKEDPERFYREVEALLSNVVDFDSFARSVMAGHYRDATPEQARRFAETFKWGLVRTYALALTEFEDGKVVVLEPDQPPRNPKRQTVTMEIHASTGEVYPVLYSVTQEDDGSWLIRNLIVNGVNMGLTYRNQFDSAMNDPKYGRDMDRVIDGWGDLLKSEAPALTADSTPGAEA
ncbi:MAG: ABC transporter substrate-binding protein [Pseudomonadales bacterium]